MLKLNNKAKTKNKQTKAHTHRNQKKKANTIIYKKFSYDFIKLLLCIKIQFLPSFNEVAKVFRV